MATMVLFSCAVVVDERCKQEFPVPIPFTDETLLLSAAEAGWVFSVVTKEDAPPSGDVCQVLVCGPCASKVYSEEFVANSVRMVKERMRK